MPRFIVLRWLRKYTRTWNICHVATILKGNRNRVVEILLQLENKYTYSFVCLFVVFRPTREFFTRVTITCEGLQIMTNARISWPFSSEGSLACHTYSDTGQSFIMVISDDPWHSHLLQSVWQWSCDYLFLRLRSVATGIRTPNLPLAERTL